jgi:hypothetical protein
VVDFGDGKVLEKLTRLSHDVMRNKLVNPDWIFSSRAEIGLYNVLHLLRAKINTTAVWLDLKSALPTAGRE